MRLGRLVAIGLAAAAPAAAAAVAPAAEPTSGQVSRDSPVVEWTGSTTNSYPNFVLINNDPDGAPCQAPTCDTFALTVVDGGFDLVVRARLQNTGTTGDANGGIRITRPDGSRVWQLGPSGPETDLKVTVKKATAGDYVVDFTNNFVGGPQPYAAAAELLVPPPPPPAAPATVPAAPPAPAAAPETRLTVRASPASARRLARTRRLAVRVTTSAPLTGVRATLTRAGRRAGTGRAARVNRSGRISLRLARRVRPGRYRLTVTGTDAHGRGVSARTSVTVRR